MNFKAPASTSANYSAFAREPETNIQVCQATAVGSTGYAVCQGGPAAGCPYAMSFGYSHFCRHPQLQQILDQTQGTGRP